MAGSDKLFKGANLGDIARSVTERAAPSPFANPGSAKPILAAAELALTGRTTPPLERENVYSVDPRRCRGWKYHNRTAAWFTKERCADLIASIPKNGQREPALVRKVNGDPDVDYEVIYGMRRRFACEYLNTKLKVKVTDVDDAAAAVLMHVENADREDITPMERAVSYLEQIEGKLFATQEALADRIGLSKGQITKMLKAAQLLKGTTIGQLFADQSVVPIEQAYKLSALLERPGAKEVIMQAAKNLARKEGGAGSPRDVLRVLITSLDRSQKFTPLQKPYNLGAAKKVVVTRNARGKVTFSFPQGLQGVAKEEVMGAVEKILGDLG